MERALNYFKADRWAQVRTLEDLKSLFAMYPADKAGNTVLALFLWDYKLWTREMLRGFENPHSSLPEGHFGVFGELQRRKRMKQRG